VADARRDPWRDPGSSPAWIAPAASPAPPPAPAVVDRVPRRVSVGTLVVVAAITALLGGVLGGGLGFVSSASVRGSRGVSLGSSSVAPLANRAPGSIGAIVKRLQPSVVSIDISGPTTKGNGSGFLISGDGYVLTNNHVAAAGEGGSLRVVFQDGASADAAIVGRDPSSDIAVLRVRKSGLPAVQFGDSDSVAVGDPVVAFGSPLGLQGTVTSGIVSSVDRPVVTGQDENQEAYMAAIQTDAAINPGNSGGPLVDGAGRVIGVNSAIATIPNAGGGSTSGSIGLGFAIPINQAKRIAEEIIATGKAKRTILGAQLDMKYSDAAGGVKLQDVPEGPAKKAGLRPGDVIVKFNGKVVNEPTHLIALVRKLPAGTTVTVTYQRDGARHDVSVTLTETS
jgi:putative serine protease PepD